MLLEPRLADTLAGTEMFANVGWASLTLLIVVRVQQAVHGVLKLHQLLQSDLCNLSSVNLLRAAPCLGVCEQRVLSPGLLPEQGTTGTYWYYGPTAIHNQKDGQNPVASNDIRRVVCISFKQQLVSLP